MSKITLTKSPACGDKIRKGVYGGVLQEHVWDRHVGKQFNGQYRLRAANEGSRNFIKTNKKRWFFTEQGTNL